MDQIDPGGRGRAISVHPMSPAAMQRASIVAVLSFFFFLAMMGAFYVLQAPVYFLLATSFLLVYVITMFSIFARRRAVLRIYEGGLTFKKFAASWSEISTSVWQNGELSVFLNDGRTLALPKDLVMLEQAHQSISSHLSLG